ncbi:MAG: efflux RND transporter periplasmic adaptor subunit [Gemmatimonadales bacterium]
MTSTGVTPIRRAHAASLLLVSLLAACGGGKAPTQPPVPVDAAKVSRQDVPYDLSAPGTVEPLQTVAVTPQVNGQITRVAFHEGDQVEAGQVLFQLDPRPFQASLDQAAAVAARDAAQLTSAEADEKRYADLAAKDYVTPQQLEQARATASALRATLAADSAAVQNARLSLQYTTIRAPITGRAGAILVREGNLAKAQGAPLVVVNQMAPILVRFAVPATALPAIRAHDAANARVHVDPTGVGGIGSDGRLSFIDNAVDSSTGTILLKGLFPNPRQELWPGELVNVQFQLFVESQVVTAPAAAVVSGQQGDYVFVIGADQTASTRPVKVERITGDLAVLSGVSPGETVVTDGQLKLRPGSIVQIKPGSATPAGGGRTGDSATGGPVQ